MPSHANVSTLLRVENAKEQEHLNETHTGVCECPLAAPHMRSSVTQRRIMRPDHVYRQSAPNREIQEGGNFSLSRCSLFVPTLLFLAKSCN